MTDTLTTTPPATDAVAERLDKLERTVKRLRKKVRQMDREEIACVVLTPEMEAELERRIKEAEENPGNSIPWSVVKAELQAKYGLT